MSESDGMDDVLDGGLRQSLLIASRIAETLARRRQESQRQEEQIDAQAAHDTQARYVAERAAMQGALTPVHRDHWWEQAKPKDIADAYVLTEAWKNHDPAALAASERIRQEVLTRYGIDTHDVGADTAYLASAVDTFNAEQARLKAVREHEKGMALIAAAQAEQLRAKAETLAPVMERHEVPVEYLSNQTLAAALQTAQGCQDSRGGRSCRHHGEGAPVPDRQRRHQRSHHRPAPQETTRTSTAPARTTSRMPPS